MEVELKRDKFERKSKQYGIVRNAIEEGVEL